MTQLTINIEDKAILPHLKKILNAIEGVSIVKASHRQKKKSGIDEAYEDVKAGRITTYSSSEELYKTFGI